MVYMLLGYLLPALSITRLTRTCCRRRASTPTALLAALHFFSQSSSAEARDSFQKANGFLSFSVSLLRAAFAITPNFTVQQTEPHLGWRMRSMPERGHDNTPEDGRQDTLD